MEDCSGRERAVEEDETGRGDEEAEGPPEEEKVELPDVCPPPNGTIMPWHDMPCPPPPSIFCTARKWRADANGGGEGA